MRPEVSSVDPPPRDPTHRAGSWLATHSVEIVFSAIVGVTFVGLLRIADDTYFFGDDWPLLLQAGTVRGLVEPYNGHLSVTILALYRILAEGFGLSYRPFQAAGLVCLISVPIAYFWTTRRLLGPPLAAIAALSMLGFGSMELIPAALNHYLALVGGIICAAALNRGRRADWVLCAAVVFSLCAAGGGVAVAAACVVHNACTRAPARRWAAVLGPLTVWGCWWLAQAIWGKPQPRATGQTLSDSVRFARDVVLSPFEHLGLGYPVLAAVVLAGFIAVGVWGFRDDGFTGAANFVAWSTAIVVWAAGLTYSRSPVGFRGAVLTTVSFRYQLIALGFALLAIVPRRPIAWPPRLPLASDPRWLAASAVLILVVAAGGAAAIRDDVDAHTDTIEALTRITKGEVVVLDLGSDVVPDDAGMSGRFFWLEAGDVRTVLRRHGPPFAHPAASTDQQLVDVGSPAAQVVGRRALECTPITEPITWVPKVQRPLYLWSDQASWTISVRRFDSEWIPIAEAGANEVVELRLPSLRVDVPWQVDAEGACQVTAPSPSG